MRVLLSAVFLVLAAWFALGPSRAATGRREPLFVPAEEISGAPLRRLAADPRLLDVGGTSLRCNDCHRLFEASNRPAGDLAQHTEISLRHGLNDACLNCHDAEDRERLVLRGGASVGLDQASTLCAQCHGPTWRDHQRGVHGRSSGSWDPASPERGRLGCTECHDPHAPAFPGIAPLPAPRSARRDPGDHGHVATSPSPLRRWRGAARRPGAAGQAAAGHSPAPGDHADDGDDHDG